MPPLNESIVEDAALEWFPLRPALRDFGGRVGEQFRCVPSLTPARSHGEREEDEAIRQLNPAIPEEARATTRSSRIVRFERRMNP